MPPPWNQSGEVVIYRLDQQDKKLDEQKKQLDAIQKELQEISSDLKSYKFGAWVISGIGGFLAYIGSVLVDKLWKG